ncbi:MAG: class I SAM-dependent methyltransferase, partial [Arenicellales bacterium]|nr:class I SAM-dependent methyltransferase [Arenicellales bacterium]MDP6949775.1 class I SAM-dependent methyltransferase [Arenicellales bacterium]
MTDAAANRYDSRTIEMMELVYGKGYLSAGGDEEVARIVSAVTIKGKGVLDIGCGLGGAAVTLVRDHQARHVHGLDIDSRVIERAAELVETAGVAEQVTLTQFGGGVLPYADNSFAVVYVTATTCHLEDLAGFFRESCRVLRADGWIVGGEWFKAASNAAFQR